MSSRSAVNYFRKVLEPGEKVQVFFLCNFAIKPQLEWIPGMLDFSHIFNLNRKFVVVTDRRLLVLKSFFWGWFPPTIAAELPPQTILGAHLKGRSSTLSVPHMHLYVEKRHYELVKKADDIARSRIAA